MTDLVETVLTEIEDVMSKVSRDDLAVLVNRVHNAERVFVAGDGRSGFMAKAFAMRLMHLGSTVHVVGETTTPALTRGDSLVAVSGSGATASTLRVAEQAEQVGATVHAVTTDPASPLATLAADVLLVPAATKYRGAGEAPTVQPLSSLFDQTTHVALDVVCLEVARLRGVDNAGARAVHDNTE